MIHQKVQNVLLWHCFEAGRLAHLGALAHWLMIDGDTLSIAATQHESITRCLALSLAHSIGAALLTGLTLLVLAALYLHNAQAVLTHL